MCVWRAGCAVCARVAQCLCMWFAVMRVWYDVQGVVWGGAQCLCLRYGVWDLGG